MHQRVRDRGRGSACLVSAGPSLTVYRYCSYADFNDFDAHVIWGVGSKFVRLCSVAQKLENRCGYHVSGTGRLLKRDLSCSRNISAVSQLIAD
jgi:hypothetical protein